MTETYIAASIYKWFGISDDSTRPKDIAKRKKIDGLYFDHMDRIKKVLDDHKILMSLRECDVVVFETWDIIQQLKINPPSYCGVQTAQQQIRDLASAIRNLSSTAKYILSKSGVHTSVRKDMLKHDEGTLRDLLLRHPTNIPIMMLEQACSVALEKNPPPGIYEQESQYDVVPIVKTGRPVNYDQRILCWYFAQIFEKFSGKKASDTEAGPFDDFVTACMTTFDPKRMTTTGRSSRKVIRATLFKYVFSKNKS